MIGKLPFTGPFDLRDHWTIRFDGGQPKNGPRKSTKFFAPLFRGSIKRNMRITDSCKSIYGLKTQQYTICPFDKNITKRVSHDGWSINGGINRICSPTSS